MCIWKFVTCNRKYLFTKGGHMCFIKAVPYDILIPSLWTIICSFGKVCIGVGNVLIVFINCDVFMFMRTKYNVRILNYISE